MKKLGVYLHIPFCSRKCSYCAFNSETVKGSEIVDKYVDAIILDIERFDFSDYIVDTVYIGGGTPSQLSVFHLKKILRVIKLNCNLSNNVEFSVEYNPEDVDKEKIKTIKDEGVNRLSIGLQSSKKKILNFINRNHTKQDFLDTVKYAKESGIENISADILVGIPGQSIGDLKSTLKLLIKNNLDHISMYDLIFEENTPMYKILKSSDIKPFSDKKLLKMYDKATSYLSKKGLQRYEVSSFSKTGFESRHNIKYWRLDEYIGFGVSAHSFINKKRYENNVNINEYISNIQNNKSVVLKFSEISLDEYREEFLLLGLRMVNGISLLEYEKNFVSNLLEYRKEKIKDLKKLNLIDYNSERLWLTKKGFELLNTVILELI